VLQELSGPLMLSQLSNGKSRASRKLVAFEVFFSKGQLAMALMRERYSAAGSHCPVVEGMPCAIQKEWT